MAMNSKTSNMNREEKAALKIHDTALKEGENYAKTHGQSLIEEVAYGRGFKSGYMKGAVDTEKEVIEKAAEWIKKNITFMHPRKEREMCAVNIGRFMDYMMEED